MPNTIDIYSTPKERFQAVEGAVKAHADMISSHHFRLALDVALLEFDHQTAKMAVEHPAAVALRIHGAQEFVKTFLGLSRLPGQLKRRDSDNLQPE